MPQLLIWGASGHARVVADIVRCTGSHQIVGFIDDLHPERSGEPFEGARILGGRDVLGRYRDAELIIAFGDCAARVEIAALARANGFTLATAIHPSAVIAATAQIKAGTVVGANAVVNPASVIGENVIINTSASVDHDCIIGDGTHVCPGVRIAGNVRIGSASWIGIGACVSDARTIGSRVMIGAGAVVVDDVPDGVIAYGVPARVIRRKD